MNHVLRCPHCDETLPAVSDAFCSFCQEPLDIDLPGNSQAHEAKVMPIETASEYTPQEVMGSKPLGYLALSAVIAIAFASCGYAVYSVVLLVVDLNSRESASVGAFFGALFGVGILTLISFAIALGLYAVSCRQLDPANFSTRGRMKQIIDATEEFSIAQVNEANRFANHSDVELLHYFKQHSEKLDKAEMGELAYEARRRFNAQR